MIVNGNSLLQAAPIKDMLNFKAKLNGYSYGLSEAGYDIRIKQRTLLSANDKFRLASSVEEFQMPDWLVGEVKDKSTWARQGLSVFNTVIEPGWKGFLTLELVYHGSKTLEILPGTGIAQVVFYRTTDAMSYSGKYQNQADMPQGAKYD